MPETDFHTSFSKATWEEFKTDQQPGPIQLLNLIRLRDQAEYSDGSVSTGKSAYRRYSDISAPVFQSLGGTIVWRGGYELTMVGPKSEVWDITFVAEYPNVQAFMSMMKDPSYRDAMIHRQAAVMDSRLVRFRSSAAGQSFAG
ncbi:DUF1330 domain-containing protein [Roseobacter sp. OBYS 0001]|uniref:DUF1330 domain-containing protein n=1 Tax=Roseobacter sp. OBYS 0001 TaxID=882651 RepID=UPI001BC0DD30|nr:DUF1330 domain-containing protein [Roseobacter sp. OBYS 0001]GIT89512.1 hypothetical protein ROBYS_45280 [Roseobacter sp. OBYS 0001]